MPELPPLADAHPFHPSAQRRISKLVSSIAPSATLAVDAKAKAMRASGEDVIGFGAGEPDFPTPPDIVAAAQRASADPAMHRYSPVAGLPGLRAAIVGKTKRDSGYEVGTENVLVTNGGKQAIWNACAAVLDPGDEVLLPVPYWTTYPEAIALAGARPVPVPTTNADRFHVRLDALEAARTAATRMVLVNSPCNPSGAVLDEAELIAIGQWAHGHGLWVLTDEIYEHLVYGSSSQHSLPVLVPEIRDRCIVVNGVAKTYAMTGWRVGWMIGPADVITAATTLQSHTTSNVSNVAQAAVTHALSGDLAAVTEMRAAFDRRRRIICEMLAAIPHVSCNEPEGAFYAFPDFTELLGRELRGRTCATTLELADLVLEEVRVAFVPGEAFGTPGYARFSYALGDDDLVEGISRVAKLFAEVP